MQLDRPLFMQTERFPVRWMTTKGLRVAQHLHFFGKTNDQLIQLLVFAVAWLIKLFGYF